MKPGFLIKQVSVIKVEGTEAEQKSSSYPSSYIREGGEITIKAEMTLTGFGDFQRYWSYFINKDGDEELFPDENKICKAIFDGTLEIESY